MKIIEDLKSYNKKLTLSYIFDNLLLNSGFQLIILYRFSNFLYRKKIPLFHRIFNYLGRIIIGSDISYMAEIGPGIKIIHGFGVVIGAEVKIGKSAYLLNDITIGSKVPGGKQPIIGDNVYIGVGARVIGDIKIGDNVKIGANSVVFKDVPSNCVVVGNPGRIIKESNENEN